MYGPASAPGMRTRPVNIFRYLFRKKKGAYQQTRVDLWQPGDGEEDAADGEEPEKGSDILPPILVLLPALKSGDQAESAAAADELVRLTNSTSAGEDTVVGRAGVLEALGHVICRGNAEGKVAAASALANLIANSDANKRCIIAMPDVLAAVLGLASLSEKGAAVSARALLNLASNREAVLALCRVDGAIDTLGQLVLTGRNGTKEDAIRVLNAMAAQAKDACVQIAKSEQVLHALKSVARAKNCSGEARLWALSTLQGLSRCSRVRNLLARQLIVEDSCIPVLTAANDQLGEWAEAMQVLATITAANLTGWKDASPLVPYVKHVACLVHVMAMALTGCSHGRHRFKNSQVTLTSGSAASAARRAYAYACALGLYMAFKGGVRNIAGMVTYCMRPTMLSRIMCAFVTRCCMLAQVLLALLSVSANDAFKGELVKAKLLELSIDMVALAQHEGGGGRGHGVSLQMVLEMVYNLMFCDAGAARLKELQGVGVLEAQMRNADPAVRKLARGALWAMGVRESVPAAVEAGKATHLYFSFDDDDKPRARKIAAGLVALGYTAIMSGDRSVKDGKKESHLCAMARGIAGAAAVVLCLSDNYNASPHCRSEAAYCHEVQARVVVLLLDDSRPAQHLANVATLLDCIDCSEDTTQGNELAVLEIGRELEHLGVHADGGGGGPPPDQGFVAGTPPTISLTDLRDKDVVLPIQDEVSSCIGPTGGVTPVSGNRTHANWDAYDSAYTHHQSTGTPVSADRPAGGWGGGRGGAWGSTEEMDDDDMYPYGLAALPMDYDILENLVSKMVSQRTRKLEARLSDMQLELKAQASDLAALRSLIQVGGLPGAAAGTQHMGGTTGDAQVKEEVDVGVAEAAENASTASRASTTSTGTGNGKASGAGDGPVDEAQAQSTGPV